MLAISDPIVWVGLERIIVVVGGVAFGFLGFLLYRLGITKGKIETNVEFWLIRFALSGTGPGLFFMAFGAAVLGVALLSGRASVSIYSPAKDEGQPKEVGNKIDAGIRNIEFKLEQVNSQLKNLSPPAKASAGKSLLQLKAVTAPALAESGGGGAACMLVSVTDANGTPVLDIDESRFAVSAIGILGEASKSFALRVNASDQPGIYRFSVFPGQGKLDRWGGGEYILSVTVDAPVGRGQTITQLSIPSKVG